MSQGPFVLGVPLVRLLIFVALFGLAAWGAHLIKDALELQIDPSNARQIERVILFGAVAYTGLLALPFVPGAEIGLAMLAAFGPSIAPLIYASTVVALMLAYLIGRFLPISVLQRGLILLRLRRAAGLVARAAALPQEDRVAMLLQGQSKRAVELGLRYRYVAIALAVNTPGNTIIGGGAGIMIIAGLSRLFSPVLTFLTVAIAVSPVPLAVLFFGLQF